MGSDSFEVRLANTRPRIDVVFTWTRNGSLQGAIPLAGYEHYLLECFGLEILAQSLESEGYAVYVLNFAYWEGLFGEMTDNRPALLAGLKLFVHLPEIVKANYN